MLSCSNELEVGMETSPMLAVYFEADAFAGLSESVPWHGSLPMRQAAQKSSYHCVPAEGIQLTHNT